MNETHFDDLLFGSFLNLKLKRLKNNPLDSEVVLEITKFDKEDDGFENLIQCFK